MKQFAPADSVALRLTEKLLKIESYAKRKGYSPIFVDEDVDLRLPGLGSHVDDVSKIKQDALKPGDDPTELRYTHFSVRQSISRRAPFYSAVNIDGARRVSGVERTDLWRLDPRIEIAHQNLRDSYGNAGAGFFSRGHMTRREDPNWGDEKTVKQADADTFHVTNAAAQQQGFNAGLWLSLEDYVLDNTDREDIKVSVLTGPIFAQDDPEYYGVKVPVSFFKIVGFKHFRTRRLTTIGYKRSQATYLPAKAAGGARFVFGDFDDTQVPIKSLAQDTSLDFGTWLEYDVMAGADVSLEVRVRNATDLYLA